MKCPACMSVQTLVKDSRPADDGRTVRRRRWCLACGNRFTTLEAHAAAHQHMKAVSAMLARLRRALVDLDVTDIGGVNRRIPATT